MNQSTNTILLDSPQMPYHTDVGRVFEAFGGLQRKYNWLLTGNERFFVGDKPAWIDGEELTRRVEAEQPVYDWAVLSGFERHIVVDLAEKRLPYADCNRSLWMPYPQPQHPQASVEIVCFDASLTLLLSRVPEFTQRFRAFFTGARDLNEYIDEHVKPVLEAWATTARTLPAGTVLSVPVVQVGQTSATVELGTNVQATIRVKQMRSAGFGPTHWFALDEYLMPGHRVLVRIMRISAEDQTAEVEFLRTADR